MLLPEVPSHDVPGQVGLVPVVVHVLVLGEGVVPLPGAPAHVQLPDLFNPQRPDVSTVQYTVRRKKTSFNNFVLLIFKKFWCRLKKTGLAKRSYS